MIISRAPVRISFFGGGTDHPEFFLKEGGAVLSTAINKYSYVTANNFLSRMFDYSLRISYSKVELAQDIHSLKHNVFRECLKHCGIKRDIALHNSADLPAYSGLGSSSALTVATLHALYAFKGQILAPHELAKTAISIEREVIKEKVGFQDQINAAFGGFNLIEFNPNGSFTVRKVPALPSRLEEFEQHLFLVYSGITRKASDITAFQLKKIKQNFSALRELKSMVYDGYNLVAGRRPFREFGKLLDEAWRVKRSLDGGVSNNLIDSIYRRGLKAGAWGGKLLGAGGGGFILFFAEPEVHPKLIREFHDCEHLTVRINAPGAEIIFPASVLNLPITAPVHNRRKIKNTRKKTGV